MGAHWLSGRVLDSRPRGHRFKLHLASLRCVLEQDTLILASSLVLVHPRKTCPFITERLLIGRKESNQTKSKYNCAGEIHMQFTNIFKNEVTVKISGDLKMHFIFPLDNLDNLCFICLIHRVHD